MPTDSASPSAAPLSRPSDESPRNLDEVSLTPHAALHQMVKHLTFDERYRPTIEAIVVEVRDTATVAARNYQVKIGFGLALPMRDALTAYEAGEGTFTEFFPAFMRRVEEATLAAAATDSE